MLITSVDPRLIEPFIKRRLQDQDFRNNSRIEIFCENVHPSYAKSIGSELNIRSKYTDIICYNPMVLDYVDLDNIYAIQDDLSLKKYKDVYREDLGYLFPGEILQAEAPELTIYL